MPQVLPPVWLLAMKAGKKLFSHALSSALGDVVERDDRVLVDQREHVGREQHRGRGRRAALVRGERLDDRLLVGAGVDRLHLDARVLLLEVGRHLVDGLGDRAADGDRVVERDFHVRAPAAANASRGERARRSSLQALLHGLLPPVCASKWCSCVAIPGEAHARRRPRTVARPGHADQDLLARPIAGGDERIGAQVLDRVHARGEALGSRAACPRGARP